MLEMSITSLIAGAMIGAHGWLGYKLINWSFATQSLWKMALSWGIWLLVAFLGAFITGGIGSLLQNIKHKELFGIAFGILWAVLLVAAVIYTWCKPPYTTGIVILRVVWSYVALGSSVWMFMMVYMISSQE